MTKTIPTTIGILIVVLVAGVAGASVLFFSQEDKVVLLLKEGIEHEKEEKRLLFEVSGDIDEKLRELYDGEIKEELLEEIYFEMTQAEKNYGIDFSETVFIEIEDFGNSFRIVYYINDIPIYGIDIDKEAMKIIDSGILG